MSRSHLVGGMAAIAISLTALTWWLFGWKTVGPAIGQRFFGRITSLKIDTNDDGAYDQFFKFTWSQPYSGPHGNQPSSVSSDRNHDGALDTWVLLELADDLPSVVYKIDLDGDAEPDWTVTRCWRGNPNDEEAWDFIEAKRGY